MKLFICLLALLLPSTCLAADLTLVRDWHSEDTAYEIVYLAVNAADLASSWSVTKNTGTYEVNPIIGRNPSPVRLVGTFAATALLHYAVAMALPPEWRRAYYSATIGVKLGMVNHNQWIDSGKDMGWTVNATFTF